MKGRVLSSLRTRQKRPIVYIHQSSLYTPQSHFPFPPYNTMTQLQLDDSNGVSNSTSVHKSIGTQKSAVLHRHLRRDFLSVERGEGNYLILEDGRKIFDASGGAAVACLGVCS